jgi:hypothetical protein
MVANAMKMGNHSAGVRYPQFARRCELTCEKYCDLVYKRRIIEFSPSQGICKNDIELTVVKTQKAAQQSLVGVPTILFESPNLIVLQQLPVISDIRGVHIKINC